jgi:hypothetical protein
VAPPSLATRLARTLGRTLRRAAGDALSGTRRSPSPVPATQPARTRRTDGATGAAAYPGDFPGRPPMSFAPHPDGVADPGEVVWTWVPYEEDHSRGKDRPVLVVGRDGEWLLALMLTSKDHDRDEAQEARAGRHWVDIGAGDWDAQGRPSEVRVDRVIRVDPSAVRRAGAALDRRTFGLVEAAVRDRR